MSEWGFVVAAYALTWLVLAGCTAYVQARAKRARELYERALGAGGGSP